MKCRDVGLLRAYLDGEVAAGESESIRQHLAACERCRDEVAELERTAASVGGLLTVAEPQGPSSAAALSRVRLRLTRVRGRRPLFGGRASRLAGANARWLVASAAAVLVALLALTPLSSAAQDFLSIFRVQKFAAVTIDPSQLPRLPALSTMGERQMAALPQVKETTVAEGAQAVDFPIRRPEQLPPKLAGSSRTFVSTATEFSFTVDLPTIEEYLARAGSPQTKLPPSLDGATIRVSVPASVVTIYGTADNPADSAQPPAGPHLYLAQSRGPTIEIPDTVDVEALRSQVLALPMLPPDLARQLQAIKDWRNTLVVPVPAGTHRDVTVAGVPALFIEHSEQERTVLWQKDGVLLALSGTVTEGDLLRIAQSVR